MLVELFYLARYGDAGNLRIQEGPFYSVNDCKDALTKHAYSWKKYTVLRHTVEMDTVEIGDPWEI